MYLQSVRTELNANLEQYKPFFKKTLLYHQVKNQWYVTFNAVNFFYYDMLWLLMKKSIYKLDICYYLLLDIQYFQ